MPPFPSDFAEPLDPLLSNALTEIQTVLDRYQIAGAVLLACRNASAWRYSLPEWSYLPLYPDGQLHIADAAEFLTAQAHLDCLEETAHLVDALGGMGLKVIEQSGNLAGALAWQRRAVLNAGDNADSPGHDESLGG